MITAKNAVTGRIVFGKPMAEIKVSEIEGGYKITVEDPSGTQELNIMNGVDGKDGQNGKDGYTPVKGKDYFDGKDGKDGFTIPEGLSILTVKTE